MDTDAWAGKKMVREIDEFKVGQTDKGVLGEEVHNIFKSWEQVVVQITITYPEGHTPNA